MTQKGILYICPTPIGNLEDITLRAIRVLKEVEVIACEDTRVTQKLLNHYDITGKQLVSYHKFSEKEKSCYLIELLEEGKTVALVSDAGTPLISDPGKELLKLIHESGIKAVPLPGASSVITALSASYTEQDPFIFLGFIPKADKEKEQILLKYTDTNMVFFESPNRLVKTLEKALQALGNRHATVARELTKIYEEINRDSLEGLISYYTQNPPRGEVVLIIEGLKDENLTLEQEELKQKIQTLKKAGYSVKELSKIISLLYGCSKNEVYELAKNF